MDWMGLLPLAPLAPVALVAEAALAVSALLAPRRSRMRRTCAGAAAWGLAIMVIVSLFLAAGSVESREEVLVQAADRAERQGWAEEAAAAQAAAEPGEVGAPTTELPWAPIPPPGVSPASGDRPRLATEADGVLVHPGDARGGPPPLAAEGGR